MKLAITSDTHFGDPTCRLVTTGTGGYQPGPALDAFCTAAGTKNDFLILLGDIFDFSVASWAEAYSAAGVFFREIRQRGIASEVIYVPGNHDFGFLHVAMHEANVVNRIKNGKHPTSRWTVPGLLDDRPGGSGFTLHGVTPRQGTPKYGGLFLDDLGTYQGAPRMTVNLAYPNLYLTMPSGRTVMMTHGHYFEPYWSYTLRLARMIAGSDLVLGNQTRPTMEDIVSVNFPLNELASSGIGQAGALTQVVRKVQREFKDGDLRRIKQYLKRTRSHLDELLRFKWYEYYKEVATDLLLGQIEKHVLQALERGRDPDRGTRRTAGRDNCGFLAAEDVAARLDEYLLGAWGELAMLNESGHDIAVPSAMLFGHTHCPMLVGSGAPRYQTGWGAMLQLYNTGGWLRPGTGGVFSYETGKGLTSVVV